jgi:hypothetical protein
MSGGASLEASGWAAGVRGWSRGLRDALAFPLTSDGRLVVAGAATLLTYVVVVLSTFPQFSLQVLARDLTDLPWSVAVLTRETYLTGGWTTIVLVAAYALLTGVAVANLVGHVRQARRSGVSTVAGIVPGFVAAGCATCGAGVLGVVGLTGALATLPFEGDLLRLAGILMLLFFLGRAGDPRGCRR